MRECRDLTYVTPGNQLYKYADDTYIVVPAVNICSREAELEHIEKSAAGNNLKINRSKSLEIIFTGSRRRHTDCYRLRLQLQTSVVQRQ